MPGPEPADNADRRGFTAAEAEQAIAWHSEWTAAFKDAVARERKVRPDNDQLGRWLHTLPPERRQAIVDARFTEFRDAVAGTVLLALAGKNQEATRSLWAGTSFANTSLALMRAIRDATERPIV